MTCEVRSLGGNVIFTSANDREVADVRIECALNLCIDPNALRLIDDASMELKNYEGAALPPNLTAVVMTTWKEACMHCRVLRPCSSDCSETCECPWGAMEDYECKKCTEWFATSYENTEPVAYSADSCILCDALCCRCPSRRLSSSFRRVRRHKKKPNMSLSNDDEELN